jgi:hypothetical protein
VQQLSRFVSLFVLFSLFAVRYSAAAEPLKSGPQVGKEIESIFEPLNVTGPFAGNPHCLVCENGANPVAMVFAREPSPLLAKLLAKLDAATVEHKKHEMGSFAVFLSEKEGLAEQLKETAKKHALKEIVLAIDPPAGPAGFNVSAEGEVTVVLYNRYEVKANHAFRKGDLTDAAIQKILADVPKIIISK